MAIAARNLGLVMRKVFGIGKPRTLHAGGKPDGEEGSNGEGHGEPAGNGPDGLLKRLFRHLRALSIRQRNGTLAPNNNWRKREPFAFAMAW